MQLRTVNRLFIVQLSLENKRYLIDFYFRLYISPGNLTNVKQLIKDGANINFADPHGWCPLMVAAWNGRTEVVEFLLNSGANISCSLKSGWTPLYTAAENGYEKIAELLIKAGANVNQPMTKIGWTPLHVAAESGKQFCFFIYFIVQTIKKLD